VITDCREHALRVRETYGIWGGLSEDERAHLPGIPSLQYPAQASTGWIADRRAKGRTATMSRTHHLESTMANYLIVAHQTATHSELLDKVRQLTEADQAAEFTLLVPATPIHHLLFFKGSHTEAEAVARDLAEKAQQRFQDESLPVTQSRVGAENPMDAIDAELTAHPDYAGIIISTLGQEHSRWLLLDLPKHVEAKYSLPIYHVVGTTDLESDAY
jgi:hypothetical protein